MKIMFKRCATLLLAVVLLVVTLALFCIFVLPQQAQAATESDLIFDKNWGAEGYSVIHCKSSAQGTLQIPAIYQGEPVTSIGNLAFNNCSSLTSVTIPDSVTSIGDDAFNNCSNLTSVAIPDSVTSIGNGVFSYCSSLTSVTIPDGVTSIGDDAFNNCRSLTGITIPASITSIGWDAFADCFSLKNVYITDPSAWCKITFESNASDPSYYATVVHVVDAKGNEITEIVLDDSVTAIPDDCFKRFANITSITIPTSVTSIGKFAFERCSNLVSVTIPTSVTGIDSCVFWGCSGLTAITIPESVTSVGDWAFYGCGSLTDVYYGGSEQQWAQVSIDEANEPLTYATIHFNASVFNDVNKTSWQYTHVKYALERNLMAGKGTDAHGRIKFDPTSPITREEFVQVLYNAEGKPSVSIANRFPDVKNEWYKNAVLWANSMNIANGMGNGNFGVGKNISRQDLALMLMKYAALKGCSLDAEAGKIDQYADGNKVSDYAKNAMDWAVTNGVLSGKGAAGAPPAELRLDPTGTATRAECAAMLRNFMTAFGL